VLGIFEGVSYEGGSTEMGKGDTLVVYSDGVTETWDPDGEEFGEDKLIAFAVSGRANGAEAVQRAILREIERFEQGARATDDRTLVVLKREAAA
jgi:sigma-B regulation protein RsbU (phosphoserine phosphatase)